MAVALAVFPVCGDGSVTVFVIVVAVSVFVVVVVVVAHPQRLLLHRRHLYVA